MSNRVTYPTGGEYRDAVFNIKRSIKDPVLSNGTPLLDAQGMPKPVSGNFATVFRVTGADNREWGVKCFTRHVSDQQQRYERISASLERVTASWRVHFEYLPGAILCNGQWYPILKMEWIEANALIPYVQRSLGQPGALAKLANEFAGLMRDMSGLGIAHGDLQHGNLLVTASGSLKLIDYDGMYVPGLERLGASELGHPNYQLPTRTTNSWGPSLDRFSAWLIYCSLVALTIEPTLWDWLHRDGDEALILSKRDFTDPAQSLALRSLAQSPDERLQTLGRTLESFLALDPALVPPFDPSSVAAPSQRSVAVTGVTPQEIGRDTSAKALAEWLQSLDTASAALSSGSNDPSWVLGHLPTLEQVKFRSTRVSILRIIVASIVAYCVALGGLLAIHLIPTGSVVAAIFFVLAISAASPMPFYLHTTEHRAKRKAQSEVHKLNQDTSTARRGVSKAESDRQAIDRREREALDKLSKLARKAHEGEQSDTAKIDADLTKRLSTITQSIQALASREASERAALLQNLQQSHVQRYLATSTLASARLPGIGPSLQATLRANGISSAADFTGISYSGSQVYINLRSGYRVHPSGVGTKKAQTLDAWRRTIENRARATQPTAVSNDAALALRKKYADQRAAFERSSTQAKAEAARSKQLAHQRWAISHTNISTQVEEVRKDFTRQRTDADLLLIQARRALNSANWRETLGKHQLGAHSGITYWRYISQGTKN